MEVIDTSPKDPTKPEITSPDNWKVTKANSLARAITKLSVIERNVLTTAISKIKSTEKVLSNPYRFTASEYCAQTGVEPHSELKKHLREALIKLKKATIIFRDEDSKFEDIDGYITKARIWDNDNYDIYFSETLTSFLLVNQNFVSYTAKFATRFKSQYSGPMYDRAKSFLGKKNKFTEVLSIQEFRDIVCVKQDIFPLYANLKDRVISVIVKDLDKSSDISMSYTPFKNGKKYEWIEFVYKHSPPSIDNLKEKKKSNLIDDHFPSDEEDTKAASIKKKLENLGMKHISSYLKQGITLEDFNETLERGDIEYNKSNLPLLIHRVKSLIEERNETNKPTTTTTEPDLSYENKLYWEENSSLYNSELLPSSSYIQVKSGGLINWNSINFVEELIPFLKEIDTEDQREINIYSLTARHWTSGQKPAMVLNRIRNAQDENLYTKWSTDSMRKNKTNPEYIKFFMIGRAYKENPELLHSIFNEIYGDNWEVEAKSKLESKGINTNFG